MARILFGKLLMANVGPCITELRSSKDLLTLVSCRNWDEKRVGEWLRVINCAQYERLFKGKQPGLTYHPALLLYALYSCVI